MTVQMDRSSAPSSREVVQRLLKKNIELENGLRKSAQSKVPSDPNAWLQMRENYETIILEDHDFSEKHDVEYALWQLHYRRIDEFRQHINAATSAGSNASSGGKVLVRPDKVKKIRSVFKSFLMEATGFYHDLILKVRAKYGLPNEGTENEIVLSKDEKKLAEIKKGLMSCHRCLIYLGDLARYKGLYGEGDSISRDYGAASSYYMQAASLCPSSGNPHHQLAILASYSGDELMAVYRYFRSLAVEIPFSTARDNLIIAFEKNRQSYSQLPSNTKMTSVRSSPVRSNGRGRGRGRGDAKLHVQDMKVETAPTKEHELTIPEVFKAFSIRFVRLHGILFTRTSLEIFEELFSALINDLKLLLSSGPELEFNFGTDAAENALVTLRLIAIMIFTVHNVKRESENQSYAEILQRSVLLQNAFTAAFEFAGYILKRCMELQDAASSFLLPSILVFIEWLACHPDIAAGTDVGEKQAGARSFFWNQCVQFMNKLILTGLASVDGDEDETCFSDMSRYDEGETENRLALWEDFELRGFSPLMPAHIILNFSRKHAYGNDGGKDKISRVRRILAAGRALASIVSVDHQKIFIDPRLKKFVLGTEPLSFGGHMDPTLSSALDSTLMKEGKQTENVAELGLELSMSNLGVAQTKAQLYIDGDEEEEEIVFKPTVPEKIPDATASVPSAFNLVNLVQASSGGNWMANAQHPSAPFDGVQMSAVSNGNFALHPSATTASQLPLQYVNSDTSRWLMKQQALLSDGLMNMNISGNGYLNKQVLQECPTSLQPTLYSPGFHPSFNLNAHSTLSNQTNSPKIVFSSPLDTLVSSGAALPSLRKNPVSRPVRHLGPPPGFTHISSKKQNEAISNYFPKEHQPEIDDYSWLDGYQSSSTKGMGMDNSLNEITHRDLYANVSSTTAFTNVSSFPFPGKQVSSVQSHAVDEQKRLDFQLFEQLKAHSGQNFEQSSPQPGLLPEHRQA
ncbi:protein SMG7 [Canna indica]|uniref:Protein SMG7 n=1 Tax=Canna indica TaxID=4628 RepID=A0AAQ3K2N4_9LILI|nr:protein SMG7 [Canna indica]